MRLLCFCSLSLLITNLKRVGVCTVHFPVICSRNVQFINVQNKFKETAKAGLIFTWFSWVKVLHETETNLKIITVNIFIPQYTNIIRLLLPSAEKQPR